MLMGLEVSSRIEREHVMFMVELMSEHLAIECPAKRVCHHTENQYQHDCIDMTAFSHDRQILYLRNAAANSVFSFRFPNIGYRADKRHDTHALRQMRP